MSELLTEVSLGTTKQDFRELKPGIYPNIRFADYADADAINNSKLKYLDKCAAKLKHYIDNGQEETNALRIGRIIHTRVLEPDKFWLEHALEPKCDKRTNVGKEVYANFLVECAGKTPVSQEELEMVDGIYSSVMNHPVAGQILDGSRQHELTLLSPDPKTGLLKKCRLDVYGEWEGKLTAFDLKSAKDASKDIFSYDARKHSYHMQSAYYLDIAAALFEMNHDDFIHMVVEKTAPYAVATYQFDAAAIAKGRSLYRKYLDQYNECKITGNWPSYTTDVQTLTLPGWATIIEEEEDESE